VTSSIGVWPTMSRMLEYTFMGETVTLEIFGECTPT
jgi:hypothetical protein